MIGRRQTMLGGALRLAAAIIGLSLAITGCDLRVTGIGFGDTRQTSGPEVAARLTASTYRYCPGDDITFVWDGGTQPEGCVPGTSCKTASLWTDPIGIAEFSGSAPENLFGSVTFAVGPELNIVRARYTVQTASEEQAKFIYLLPVAPLLVSQEFEFKCDPASNTWQFMAGPLVPPEGETIPEGACMAITGIETAWHNIRVHHPDGSSTDLSTFSRNDTALDGYQPSDLDIEVTGSFDTNQGPVSWSSLVGQPCQPGDQLPNSSPQFHDAFRYLMVAYTIGCVPPADIYDPQARAECQRRHNPETPVCTVEVDPTRPTLRVCTSYVFQPLEGDGDTQPPGEDDGIIPICDLNATCGNSVCDDYCENATSCPADCAVSALCAANGGIAYQAEICTCQGVIDQVTICGDNSKIDTITDTPCTPNPQDCSGNGTGGTDGGDQCQASVCGDGKCDFPNCEDSMTCPLDCFG